LIVWGLLSRKNSHVPAEPSRDQQFVYGGQEYPESVGRSTTRSKIYADKSHCCQHPVIPTSIRLNPATHTHHALVYCTPHNIQITSNRNSVIYRGEPIVSSSSSCAVFFCGPANSHFGLHISILGNADVFASRMGPTPGVQLIRSVAIVSRVVVLRERPNGTSE
jgi:hypothetical protein